MMKLDIQMFADAGKVIIGTEIDTKKFDAQIKAIENELNFLEKKMSKPKEYNIRKGDMDELAIKTEKLRNKLVDLYKQREKIINPPVNPSTWVEDMGKKLETNIKKVKSLVFGIFSIRSAYMAVRNAMNVIVEDDAQLKADIDFLKNVLAYSLEPIVRTIVSWVKVLASLVRNIIYSLFGYDIFAKASEKSLKNTAGYAKEIRKQLAPFDEMNILGDNVTSSGGGIDDTALPDFEGYEKGWNNFKNKFKNIMEEMRQALFDMPFEVWTKAFGDWDLAVYGVVRTFYGLGEQIQGLYKTIKGFADFVMGIIQGDSEKVMDGLSMMFEGFVDNLDGLKNIILGFWDVAVGIGKGFAGVIEDLLVKIGILPEKQKTIKDSNDKLKESEEELTNAMENRLNMQNRQIYAIENEEKTLAELQKVQEETGISIDEIIKYMHEQGKSYKDLNEEQRKVYKAYVDHEGAVNTLNEVEKELNKTTEDGSKKYQSYGKDLATAFEEGGQNASKGKKVINDNIDEIDKKGKNVFESDLPRSIVNAFNSDNYSNDIWGLVNRINDILTYINPIQLAVQASGSLAEKLKSFFGFAKGGIVVPKLASGGIINQPGKGVPIGSAVGGERGMEGVIPLTDSQQMELLGNAIGRYITINANIVNTMNGKVISRELKQIQSEEDFAFNR